MQRGEAAPVFCVAERGRRAREHTLQGPGPSGPGRGRAVSGVGPATLPGMSAPFAEASRLSVSVRTEYTLGTVCLTVSQAAVSLGSQERRGLFLEAF